MEGAGSLWNANSWHWEEKNYNKWAHQVIKEKLALIKIEEISITAVTKVKGEAAINIRKGKTIFLFEFEIDCEWNAPGFDGTLKLLEFNQDDLDDIQLRATCKQGGREGDALRYKLCKQGQPIMQSFFETFLTEMKRMEADKVEQDRTLREEAKVTTAQAQAERGEQKDAILAAAKQAEVVQRVDRVEEVKGSEWNTGSYFWEERTIVWANDRLLELLNGCQFNLPGGVVQFETITAPGGSTFSVRKGKKITAFQYEIDMPFKASLKDGDHNVLDEAKGSFKVPEFAADDDYDVHIELESNNPIIRGYLRTEGVKVVQNILMQFVNELRTRDN